MTTAMSHLHCFSEMEGGIPIRDSGEGRRLTHASFHLSATSDTSWQHVVSMKAGGQFEDRQRVD